MLLSLAVPAFAAQSGPPASAFADELFLQGDYFRAITEYKRVVFEDPSNMDAALRCAESYLLAGHFEEAERAYRELSIHAVDTAVITTALRKLAEALKKQGSYADAAQTLLECLERVDADQRDAVQAELFWCRLYAEDLPAAQASVRAINDEHLQSRLSRAESTASEFQRKSPTTAGCLSAVIPGSGQLYVGRKRDALISFTVNAAFIWAAIEAYDEDLDFTGTAFAIVELSWYAGNIYSAVNGAHKHNRFVREREIRSLESEFGDIVSQKDTELRSPIVPLVALSFRF